MPSIAIPVSLRGQLLSGARQTLTNILFSANEPGFTFEPWDITTLYQDRAGTTPVTAAGQSVGLRLSKDQGLRQGPELVTNGTFDTGITGWSSGLGSPTLSWVSSGAMRVTRTIAPVNFSVVSQTISGLTVGKRYNVAAIFSNISSGTNPYVAINSVAVGTDRLSFVANATSHVLEVNTTTGAIGTSFDVDNISVRELAGNHEVAVSDAKRGVYGWMPKTGRRNLLTYTEQFDNAAWTKTNTTVTADATAAPDGTNTADKLSETATTASHYAYQTYTSTGVRIVSSVYAKAAERRRIAVWEGTTSANGAVFDLISGTVVNNLAAGVGSIQSVGDGWYRCSVTSIETAGTRWLVCSVLLDDATGVGGTVGVAGSGIYVWGAQLELGSTATAYQRVVSQYDVTEAGVPTCYYVQADGVDDAYVTPTITPNTDKVQVFAGVRKLSDATGIIIEPSTLSGSFYLVSGSDTGVIGLANGYTSLARGSAAASAQQNSQIVVNGPDSAVITATHDIAGDMSTIRRNGIAGASGTGDKGTGNFLAYPTYIYARAGTSSPFNGLDFGHAVRFGPNLDAATIARVESLIARNTPEVTL